MFVPKFCSSTLAFMGWIYLGLTILLESAAIICMKLANGFTNRYWSVMAVITYMGSFILLTLALRKLPAGLANAIWAGASTLLVALLGNLLFKESIGITQLFFLLLIVTGLIGLHFSWK